MKTLFSLFLIPALALGQTKNATINSTTGALVSPPASQFYTANPPPSSSGTVTLTGSVTGTGSTTIATTIVNVPWSTLTGSLTAGGDLQGSYPNPSVNKVQGVLPAAGVANALGNFPNASGGFITFGNALSGSITLTGSITGTGTNSILTTLANASWSVISGTPTTLSGYGITDGVTSTTLTSTLTSYAPLASPNFTGAVTYNGNAQNTTNGLVTVNSDGSLSAGITGFSVNNGGGLSANSILATAGVFTNLVVNGNDYDNSVNLAASFVTNTTNGLVTVGGGLYQTPLTFGPNLILTGTNVDVAGTTGTGSFVKSFGSTQNNTTLSGTYIFAGTASGSVNTINNPITVTPGAPTNPAMPAITPLVNGFPNNTLICVVGDSISTHGLNDNNVVCTTVSGTTTVTITGAPFITTVNPLIYPLQMVYGPGIPAGTMVKSVNSTTSITLSGTATASATGTVIITTSGTIVPLATSINLTGSTAGIAAGQTIFANGFVVGQVSNSYSSGSNIPLTFPVRFDFNGNVIYSGSSIVFSTNLIFIGKSWTEWLSIAPALAGKNVTIKNFAIGGTNIAQAVTSYTANVHPLRDVSLGGSGTYAHYIFIPPVGGNDASTSTGSAPTAALSTKALWAMALADGFDTYGCTIPMKQGPTSIFTTGQISQGFPLSTAQFNIPLFNEEVRQQAAFNPSTGLPLLSHPVIDFERSNVQINELDQIHPTPWGFYQMAQTVLQSLLTDAEPPIPTLNPTIASITPGIGNGVLITENSFGLVSPTPGAQTTPATGLYGLNVANNFNFSNTTTSNTIISAGRFMFTTTGGSENQGIDNGVTAIAFNNSSSTKVDTLRGLDVWCGIGVGGGTASIGTSAGVYVEPIAQGLGGTYTITSNYGIYISSQSNQGVGCTFGNTYALYQFDPGDLSQFNGTVSAGTINTLTLSTPATPTIAPQGTGGSATWSYVVVAKQKDGSVTAASAIGTTTTGTTTLSSGNNNKISWTSVSGAYAYDIYRTTVATSPSTLGKIGTVSLATAVSANGVCPVTLSDTGLAGDATTAPTLNTTGRLTGNLVGGITSAYPPSPIVGERHFANLSSTGTLTLDGTVTSPGVVSLSTGSPANVVSLNLTAGHWLVNFNANTSAVAATTTLAGPMLAGSSTTTATLPTDGTEGYSNVVLTLGTATNTIPCGTKEITLTGSGTVYGVEQATFSAGTISGFGALHAIRLP